MNFQRIDIVRVRLQTTLLDVRAALAERERYLGAHETHLYLAVETKFWTHDWRACVHPEGGPRGPRGEAVVKVRNWRAVLDKAEASPACFGDAGLAAFMAAHGDNCLHPFENRAWSAMSWSAYAHALRRARPQRSAA